MSQESSSIARAVVAGFAIDQSTAAELIRRITKALDESWNQGFEDCLTMERLKRMGKAK